MERTNRKTGIDIIGDMQWGRHLCIFYQSKEDLFDILVPYFKAGLENNEFCMWVTSEPINAEEAKNAMESNMPDFERYFNKGQIEILPYAEWYFKGGVFNLQRALNAWIDKHNQALSKGFSGIRITGNTTWLEKKDWEDFTNYEEKVNKAIGKYRMLALCTYSLDKCEAAEIIDVINIHQAALIRRKGKWELIESTEHKQAMEAFEKSEQKVRAVLDQTFQFIGLMTVEGVLIEANRAALDFVGIEESAVLNKPFWETPWWTHSAQLQKKLQEAIKKTAAGEFVRFEATHTAKDGSLHYIDFSLKPVKDETGEVIFMIPEGRDITERKKTEVMLSKINECFINFGSNPDENIKKIVEIAGIIFESTCSLYNKEEGDLLRTDKGWNLPDDFNQKFTKAGHICYDVIKRGKDEPYVANNLDKTAYAQTDPNVSKYSFKTYIGCVVKINDKPIGSLCLAYQENRVFSSDELRIFSILSKALGIEEERKQAEEELKKSASTLKEQKLALEQKNLALKEMVDHIERTKNKMKEDIAMNINESLLPILEKLKIKGAPSKYINLLHYHLKELSSSFSRKITQKSNKLTPKEIDICNMLKGNLSTKDISKLLNVSIQTIEKHRNNIRKKLGISHKKVNLISFLQNL